MNKVIVFLLNKLPLYTLDDIAKVASLKINDGKIAGYKRIRNPHTDRKSKWG